MVKNIIGLKFRNRNIKFKILDGYIKVLNTSNSNENCYFRVMIPNINFVSTTSTYISYFNTKIRPN